MADDPVMHVTGPGEGEVYSPHEVPPGINMDRAEWAALSDTQRQLIGDRRFARPATRPTGDPQRLPLKDEWTGEIAGYCWGWDYRHQFDTREDALAARERGDLD